MKSLSYKESDILLTQPSLIFLLKVNSLTGNTFYPVISYTPTCRRWRIHCSQPAPGSSLVRKCKFPMKPDTQLRKYINKTLDTTAALPDAEAVVSNVPPGQGNVRTIKNVPQIACVSSRQQSFWKEKTLRPQFLTIKLLLPSGPIEFCQSQNQRRLSLKFNQMYLMRSHPDDHSVLAATSAALSAIQRSSRT